MFSQENILVEAEENETSNYPPLFDIDKIVVDELVWVVDSIYHEEYTNNEWELLSRNTTPLRNLFADPLLQFVHKWNSDEEVWVNRDSTTYAYHETGKLNSSLKQNWNNATQAWSDTSLYEKHSETEKLLYGIFKPWNSLNNTYTYGSKLIRSYDANDNYILNIGFNLKLETDTWIKQSKTELNYDVDNKLTLSTTQQWSQETSTWTNSSQQSLYMFDEYGNQISRSGYTWDIELTEWVEVSRYTLTFNENSDLTSYLSERYEEGIGWYSYLKLTNTYDGPNGEKTYSLVQRWIDGEFINWSQIHIAYDENGNEIENLKEKWNADDGVWDNFALNTSSYTANGDLDNLLRQRWTDEAWVNQSAITNTYDENNNLIESIRSSGWDIANEWFYKAKSTYYWSSIDVVNTDNIISDKTQITPNPTSGIINITSNISLENASVKIYATSGKLMQTIQLNNQNTIDISRLPNGIYFVNILTKEGHLVKKVKKT